MRNISFANNCIYHIYNRGVDRRIIFLEDADYFRFIHDLYEFNDTDAALNFRYKEKQLHDVGNREVGVTETKKKRNLIVDILSFCLMPNHFHLLLRQKVAGGTTLFMRKLGSGYANYFNQKYQRSGTLFQGKFKAVPIVSDSQLLHIPYYIHANPVDLMESGWKQNGLSKSKTTEITKFLESYRWSSYPDYIGKKNFSSVTQREFLTKIISKPKIYEKSMSQWIQNFNPVMVDEISLD